jgi:hypothetical protein
MRVLLMKSKQSQAVEMLEVDDWSVCKDKHKPDDIPLFHKHRVFSMGARGGVIVARRCPESLSQDEQLRVFEKEGNSLSVLREKYFASRQRDEKPSDFKEEAE